MFPQPMKKVFEKASGEQGSRRQRRWLPGMRLRDAMHGGKLCPLRDLIFVDQYRLFELKVMIVPDLRSDLHSPTPRQIAPIHSAQPRPWPFRAGFSQPSRRTLYHMDDSREEWGHGRSRRIQTVADRTHRTRPQLDHHANG